MLRRAPTLLLLLVLAACDQGNGLVRGESLVVPGCKTAGEDHEFAPFSMTLNVFTVVEEHNLGSLRMASRAGYVHDIDHLGIDIWDVRALKAAIEDGPVTLELHPGTVEGETFTYSDGATMAFTLMGRCRLTSAALGTTGTLTFERYSAKDAAHVVGSFDVDVFDRRTGATLGTGITGEFDFVVDTATPATPFQPENF